MEQHPYQPIDQELPADFTADQARAFTANVFSWMTLGLAITAVTAYLFGTTDLMQYLYNPQTGGRTILFWIVLFAPFGFILGMNFGLNKLSKNAVIALFLGFSAVMGMSLFYVFAMFSMAVVTKVFLITAGTFGIMAVLGYTTKTDLTAMGGILRMALIGLIIAMVVNMFMASPMMHYIISGIGVLIFTGLTAYDTQKIKRIGAGVEMGTASASKLAIMGATSLYLDFINLFLFLLRFMGSRD